MKKRRQRRNSFLRASDEGTIRESTEESANREVGMTVVGLLLRWLVAGAAVGVMGLVVFGLVTGRLNWRTEGCCPANPVRDLRMRGALGQDPSPTGPASRAES